MLSAHIREPLVCRRYDRSYRIESAMAGVRPDDHYQLSHSNCFKESFNRSPVVRLLLLIRLLVKKRCIAVFGGPVQPSLTHGISRFHHISATFIPENIATLSLRGRRIMDVGYE